MKTESDTSASLAFAVLYASRAISRLYASRAASEADRAKAIAGDLAAYAAFAKADDDLDRARVLDEALVADFDAKKL